MKLKRIALLVSFLISLSISAIAKTDDETAIDFFVSTLDGKTYSLEDFKGKILLVIFWSTSCPICQKELPELDKSLNNLQAKVEVLAITPENETKVSRFLKQTPLSFIIGINGIDVILKYAEKNSKGEFFMNYPYYVLISPQGKIFRKTQGERKIEKVLQAIKLLANQPI